MDYSKDQSLIYFDELGVENLLYYLILRYVNKLFGMWHGTYM